MYGAAVGVFFKLAGIFQPLPEPPGVVFHWANFAGQCIAAALIVAIFFSIAALVRNYIIREP
jgi:hypothetical protein